jgi:hypothetical protein
VEPRPLFVLTPEKWQVLHWGVLGYNPMQYADTWSGKAVSTLDMRTSATVRNPEHTPRLANKLNYEGKKYDHRQKVAPPLRVATHC